MCSCYVWLGRDSETSQKLSSVERGRWWWWWRDDVHAAGAANSWDIFQNFAPRRTLQMLQLPQPPQQLLHQQQSPQPPSVAKLAVQQLRSRVRSCQKKRRKAGPKWPGKKKRKSPKKTEDKTATARSTLSQFIPTSVTAPIPPNIIEHPIFPETKAPSKKKPKDKTTLTTKEALDLPMVTTTNLKRRRNSGEGAAKKMFAGPPCADDPLEGPSNAFQPTPQQPTPQQTLPRIPIPFLPPPFPPPPLPPLPPSQYPTPQHVPPEPLQIPQPPKPFQPPRTPQLEQSQPPKTRPHQI